MVARRKAIKKGMQTLASRRINGKVVVQKKPVIVRALTHWPAPQEPLEDKGVSDIAGFSHAPCVKPRDLKPPTEVERRQRSVRLITDDVLNGLTKTTLGRAVYARQLAAKYPTLVEQDNNFMPWVYCEYKELWYSFTGNYSKMSPEEKFEEAWKAERDSNRRFMAAQQSAFKYYKLNLPSI